MKTFRRRSSLRAPINKPERLYIRRPDSDTWHWMENCSKYPKRRRGEFTERLIGKPVRPRSGELCNECIAKARKARRAKA